MVNFKETGRNRKHHHSWGKNPGVLCRTANKRDKRERLKEVLLESTVRAKYTITASQNLSTDAQTHSPD